MNLFSTVTLCIAFKLPNYTFTAQSNEKMSKKEVCANIDKTKHDITSYDTKFLRVHNRLVKLKQDYEASKDYAFTTRYTVLKDLIKTVIKDKKLFS